MTEAVETVRRYDAAFGAKDAEARAACLTEDIELVMPGGMTLHGPAQVGGIVQAFWEALPDSKINREDDIVAGDTVVTEGTLTGTHTGTFRTPQGEIPPSGNRITLPYVSVRRIRDGKIASEHLYFDQLEFLQQLGALPAAERP